MAENHHKPRPCPDTMEMQVRRIRWKTGLTGPAARLVAALVYGEARQ